MNLTALIQAALLLLTLAQTTPNLPPALKENAIQTAQIAIQLATQQGTEATTTPTIEGETFTDPLTLSGTANQDVYLVLSVGKPVASHDSLSGTTAILHPKDGRWKTKTLSIHGWGTDTHLPAGDYTAWLYDVFGNLLVKKQIEVVDKQ